MNTRVVAVVVTWNRRDLLEESLAALEAQTLPPSRVVVVDNASTDGTPELLASSYADQDRYDVVSLTTNTGGAGGFTAGIERALTHDPELVWLLDDDTVPTATAAEELVRAWSSYPGGSGGRPALLASKVVWTDGRDHPMNTPRPKPGAGVAGSARPAPGGGGPAGCAAPAASTSACTKPVAVG